MKTTTQCYYSPSLWRQVIAIDAICPDGKIRKVRVGQPNTYFSIPGRCSVRKKTVSGWVYSRENLYIFYPNRTCKNTLKVFQEKPFIPVDKLEFNAKYLTTHRVTTKLEYF